MGADVDKCVEVLRRGGVVLHATEGVWGFACDPDNPQAVDRILRIKRRSVEKGLLVIAGTADEFAAHLAAVDHRDDVLATWPGRHTWVLPNLGRFDEGVTGGRDTIACRVPGHSQSRELCNRFGGPLVSTSANRAEEEPVLTEDRAREQFAGEVDMILPGRTCGTGAPSTIRGLDGAILR